MQMTSLFGSLPRCEQSRCGGPGVMGANSSRQATESTTLLEAPPPPPEPEPEPVPPPDPYVPGRTVILASSIVFVIASLLLLIEFVLIQQAADATTINVFGALEGIGWVAGFALLLDWQVSYLFPLVGVSRRALLGCVLKLVAAVFFNVQPFSWLVAGDSSSCRCHHRSLTHARAAR
jgi:hypothetical protein